MLVLLDRAFDGNVFLAEVHATGAMLLCRAKSARTPEVLGHLPMAPTCPAWTAWMCASSRLTWR